MKTRTTREIIMLKSNSLDDTWIQVKHLKKFIKKESLDCSHINILLNNLKE